MNQAIQSELLVDPLLDEEIDSSRDPLVIAMKNEYRLENLRTNMRVNTTLLFNTSPMSRVMRRDWNIVSAKLFINTLSKSNAARIKDDLIEFNWQCKDLHKTLEAIPMDSAEMIWLRPRQMNIQIVHPFAATWLRSMRTLDDCYAIMIHAERAGRISRKQRWALAAPCQLAYMGFKSSAMDIELKSVGKLIEEANL